MLLSLALVFSVRRRRASVAVVGMSLSLVLGCGAPEPARTSPALERTEASPAAAVDTHVQVVPAFAQITERASHSLGTVAAPIVSPDGGHVLISSADYTTLSVLDVASGQLRELVTGARVGYEPRWQDEGRSVAYRGAEDTDTGVPSHALALDGSERAVAIVSDDGHAWLSRGDGQDEVLFRAEGVTRRISAGGDRYLLPSLSPDRGHVAYWGVETGVFVYRAADEATWIVGDPMLDPGQDQGGAAPSTPAHFGHPRFDGSSRYLVFERTRDDGHAFTEGQVMLADLSRSPVRVARLAADGIVRQPSLSTVDARGEAVLAFLRDDVVVIATLEVRR